MEGKTNGMQIAGFVVSLVSCFIFGFYGLTGITGCVLSAVGRSQAKQVGGKTGLGTAGIVLGALVLLAVSLVASITQVCFSKISLSMQILPFIFYGWRDFFASGYAGNGCGFAEL